MSFVIILKGSNEYEIAQALHLVLRISNPEIYKNNYYYKLIDINLTTHNDIDLEILLEQNYL